jgi:tetratricopeptide (TPR) repeat protein
VLRPGERLAKRYEILAEIGRGGMGHVFEAHDSVLERKVAVKVVTATVGLTAGFEHEAKLAAKLDHPAIVPVYDFGRDGDHLFFIMPIVEGLTLRQMLADGPLPQVVAAVIVRQVAEALAHSHARGVIHRDIKPENIMVILAAGTEGPRVKVLDFGIAFSQTDPAAPSSTGTPKQIVGTPDYLSPEQAQSGLVDARSDVYALGVLLYECCVGAPPFAAPDVFKLVEQIVHQPAPRLLEKVPSVDPIFDQIVTSCLAKDASLRPQSADKIVELLATAAGSKLRSSPVVPVAPQRTISQNSLRKLEVGAQPAPSAQVGGVQTGVHSTLPAAPRIFGRDAELERVRSRLAAAARGDGCQLIAIGGGFGIGKSAFVSAVTDIAQESKIRVLRGRFLLTDDDDVSPYQAISDAFAGFFRTTTDGEEWFQDPNAREKGLLEDLVGLFPQLRGIVRLPSDAKSSPPIAKRAKTFELMSRALAALTARGPILLILEDIHSARSSVDVLRYILRRLAQAPLAIVITHRTGDMDPDHPLVELRSALLGEPTFLDLELLPLSRPDSDALAASQLPGAGVDPAELKRLYELTEGNPLHLSELTAALREVGQLKVEEGVWRLAPTTETTTIPASIRAVVERRLSRLSPAERGVLEAGAIFGRSFTYEDVAVLGVPMIDAALDRLIRGGLVNRDSTGARDRYVFAAVIVAETAREAIGPGRRRDLHRRFAEHLIGFGRAMGAEATRVVHHLMNAGERAMALPFAVRAASHALDVSVPEDVFHVVRLVGDPSGPVTKEEIELLLLHAQAHARSKDKEKDSMAKARSIAAYAVDLLEKSRPLRTTKDLETVEVAALRLSAELAWRERDRETALMLARKARAMASAFGRGDDADAIDPLVNAIERPAQTEAAAGSANAVGAAQVVGEPELLGERLLIQGDYLAARELLDRADARRGGGGGPAQSAEAEARHALKSALLAHRLGSYDEAELIARSAQQLVSSGPLAGEIDAGAAQIQSSRGRFEAAWSLVQTAIDRLGGVTPEEQRVRALLLRSKGDASMGLGRLIDATDAYDQSGRLLDPLAEPLEHSNAIFGSGDARIGLGKPDEAQRFLERAERLKLAIGDRWGLAHVHEGFARVCLCKGRIGDAISHAQRAVMLAAAIADPKLTALTRARLGLAYLSRGDTKEAQSAVNLALRDAEGCGAEPEIAGALAAVAEVHLHCEENPRAAEHAKEAYARALSLGLVSIQIAALCVTARAQKIGAVERIEEATSLAERLGNAYTKLDVALAGAVVKADDSELDAIVKRAAALGAARHVGEALLQHAKLWVARNSHERATPLFMQASAVFAETGASARAEQALKQVQ